MTTWASASAVRLAQLGLGANSPLRPEIARGFEYADCWVDDSRLVVLNAIAAAEAGARIATRTRCRVPERYSDHWQLQLELADGRRENLRARAPWSMPAAPGLPVSSVTACSRSPLTRSIQGSHLIVPRLHDGEQAYILQNETAASSSSFPTWSASAWIGTTDREYRGDPASPQISGEEIDYLLQVVNAHFRRQLVRGDILHSFSGVRPLCDDESDDPSSVTRDYTLELSGEPGQPPLLSVFGGKLTTYRKLAESALSQLAGYFPKIKDSWTASAPLPGGRQMSSVAELSERLCQQFGWLPLSLAKRWASSYGSRTWRLLEGVSAPVRRVWKNPEDGHVFSWT